MKDKLIIWDFDGVISDTEVIWLNIRRNAINKKFHTNYDMQTCFNLFGGTNDNTKKAVLEKLGHKTEQKFWDDVFKQDIEYMKINGLKTTPMVTEIFKMTNFAQCIATSGRKSKTDLKLKYCGILNYFSEDVVFTADDVKEAKPRPDLFLFAAKKMGYNPKDCIVIEDSLAGMRAGVNAKMHVIAFIGNDLYNNENYLNEIKKIGIKDIFFHMMDIKKYLEEYNDE